MYSEISLALLLFSANWVDRSITSSTTDFGEPLICKSPPANLDTSSYAICHAAASPIGSAAASTPIRIAWSANTRPAYEW
ncbi:unannotated protein [freshwater metagenome]|uniref:Unannotated protein n=1 Tax=freshwater metagenome TaxID=449393 RepID=A0A6J6NQF5_9ZZZZ